jgi:hypothetical protein
MEDVGLFYGHLVYFTAICYTYVFCGHLKHFMVIWYIFPILVCCTKKNLATLTRSFGTGRVLRISRASANAEIAAVQTQPKSSRPSRNRSCVNAAEIKSAEPKSQLCKRSRNRSCANAAKIAAVQTQPKSQLCKRSQEFLSPSSSFFLQGNRGRFYK